MLNAIHNPTLELRVLEWTEGTALSRACVDADACRADQLEQLRDAVADERLPAQAVDTLIAAGWIELSE